MADKSLMRQILFHTGFLLLFVIGAGGSSKPAVIAIDSTLTVVMLQREIYLDIRSVPDKDRLSAMNTYVQAEWQNNRKFLVKKGFRTSSPVYRIPWNNLNCDGKHLAIKTLFPKDRLNNDGWTHIVTYGGTHGETLWRISSWFAGSGTHAQTLAKMNNLKPNKLGIGTKVLIPKTILISCLSNTLDYPMVVDELTYKKDNTGVYAEYILLSGQTVYSLVLKFTPRVTAKDVMAASEIILNRTGLTDFRSIPENTVLKIPSDIISPQFLPPNDPLRLQFEETDRESRGFRPHEKAFALQGVTVILDAGHGGVDPGAIGIGGIKEDEYAYDVMCRVKRILETETKASVFVTIEDLETGFVPRQVSPLCSGLNREQIRTTPPYPIEDTGIALNMRWILANYIFYNNHEAKTRTEKVVFTSFHADSLHANAQGLMVYVPGADYYSGKISKTQSVYLQRKEAKSGINKVSSTRRDRLQAEGYSTTLAEHIKAQCGKSKIRMHSNQPIRKFVVRNRRPWVPSILRYCKVPTRVLIEVANLQNQADVKRIMDPEFRDKLARMYVDSLKAHFSED